MAKPSPPTVAVVLKSLSAVPVAAVPAIIDCVLSSSAFSPSDLFAAFIESFPQSTKGEESSCVLSHFCALCHLTNNIEDRDEILRRFIDRILLPVMSDVNLKEPELWNQLEGLFCDLVLRTQSWELMGTALVPLLLRTVGRGVGMIQSVELVVYQWNKDDVADRLVGSLALTVACSLLTSLLNVALRCKRDMQKVHRNLFEGYSSIEPFVNNLTWDLYKLALGVLKQSLENRSLAVHSLLPIVINSVCELSLISVLIQGSQYTLSRTHFSAELWDCCTSLFSRGNLERLDAYTALSLYFSAFYHFEELQNVLDCNIIECDLISKKEFWEEMQNGLVDKDSSVQKEALHILKIILNHSSFLESKKDQYSSGGSEVSLDSAKTILNCEKRSSTGVTKREKWAEEEAMSLGVREVSQQRDQCVSCHDRWEVFVLLYEMLEEYGTHLVEAAWSHQVSLLFQRRPVTISNSSNCQAFQVEMENLEAIVSWLAVLWERGFSHGNPQVRCFIMESFLSIEWEKHGNLVREVPQSFVLGPLIRSLNDVVHHGDFGIKGSYSSKTLENAKQFFQNLSHHLSVSERVILVWRLAFVAKEDSFGRAGLMTLVSCIASAACQSDAHCKNEVYHCVNSCQEVEEIDSAKKITLPCSTTELMDALGLLIERSKRHFNANYRLKVCEQILNAASSLIRIVEVPLEVLLHFLATIPREFTELGGPLREMMHGWLTFHNAGCSVDNQLHILSNLTSFSTMFIVNRALLEITYDDEDADAWGAEAKRWARMLFLVVSEQQHLTPVLEVLQKYIKFLGKQECDHDWLPVKLLILLIALTEELQIGWRKLTCYTSAPLGADYMDEKASVIFTPRLLCIYQNAIKSIIPTLEDLIKYANSVSTLFWLNPVMGDAQLPGSIRGKLGGPSQRRLPSVTTSAVLQAIFSIKAVASIYSISNELIRDESFGSSIEFLWNFSWATVKMPMLDSENGAEVGLAAYEALTYAFRAFSTCLDDSHLNIMMYNYEECNQSGEAKSFLDTLVLAFLDNINHLLAYGFLTRSRRAVLMNWKWICLEALLSIPDNSTVAELQLRRAVFFSHSTLSAIFSDIVESLENAGESSALPMLKSVRLILKLLCTGRTSASISASNPVTYEMMYQLVESSWILHLSCNKRRVAPIAALLSGVLHQSVFNDPSMHETKDNQPGPLKLFVKKLLDEGQKSPRTIRLAALHLTGLWHLYPSTIKYYIEELKVLCLYGSVAFDEDFEAEITENHEAKTEVSLLAQSPDAEFTEVFINTEMYARASVAALFYKLANISKKEAGELKNDDMQAATESGKLFLLELLDSAVDDKDLSKELYKKYSGIHRRKVRVWQMICVLSHFVEQDIVDRVTSNLHICLYRNNLPAVRQYLETFSTQIYLRFSSLAEEQLIPIFRDYNMRTQALSSYVFIAANVILHETELTTKMKHLNELLPPIIPFLTSHHHSLRGFTQLLVFHVLCKLWPTMKNNYSETATFERQCFNDLRSYLAENTDCLRLRASMEGFLDNFDPHASATPAGIFCASKQGSEFECVPIALMDQVTRFLNDVREDLRHSISLDAMKIKNESMNALDVPKRMGELAENNLERQLLETLKDTSLDFQKKITLQKVLRSSVDDKFPKMFSEIEKEDQLFSSVLQARNQALEKIKQSQQQFILVGSLIDRIPNLAGLARTCEIFKAAGFAIADASILQDKQFQLISVTAEKWVPIIEVPVKNMKSFLEKKRQEGFSILGLEQTANSTPLDQFSFPTKTVLVLGREKEGIPVDIIHILDACIEIPQLGIIRSLNVHVSGAIALWEYTRQQRTKLS